MNNIILIGMPGAGKSTIGVILAKVLGFQFIDTDLIIQERENRLLKDIILKEGIEGFTAIEDRINKSIMADRAVISPGGSVVYCKDAMENYRKIGIVIYINLSFETIQNRLRDIKKRGVVLREGQSLEDLYKERCPLYEQYAHITIDADNMDIEAVMETIKDKYEEYTRRDC